MKLRSFVIYIAMGGAAFGESAGLTYKDTRKSSAKSEDQEADYFTSAGQGSVWSKEFMIEL